MLDLLAGEWTKLRSVRSTYLALLTASVLSILIGLLVTNADVSQWPHKTAAERAGFDPASDSMLGAAIAQFAFGVLGVLAITSEYSTGMIRTSFAAVPQRRALLAGKAAVTGAVTLTTGTVLVFAAFLLGQAVLSPQHLGVSLSSPHAARAVLYACCYLLIVTLLGFGLGSIIRNTAGAITALISLTLLIPQLVSALPPPWSDRIGEYLPYSAARSATATHPVPGTLPPTLSILVCAAYAAVALGAALLLVDHRDA